MRVYHLLKAKWGLQSIGKQRLKISRFSDLNDPFELLGANLREMGSREAFRRWKNQVGDIYGLMCFSESWLSPLLWSHYAERHHGLCLGFEVPEGKALAVRYLDSRIEFDEHALDEPTIMHFLTTKFVEWSYEKEIRLITDLSEIDARDGNYYMDMSNELQLKEVIVGALSDVTRDRITAEIDAAGFDASQIELTKARLAFKSYAVVKDKRGLR